VRRAAEQGVELFALTDHDEVGGIAEAAATAGEIGLAFVPGVEISVTWAGRTVHVVGLGIDADDRGLREGLASVRCGRTERARRMGDGLARAGIDGVYEGALKYVGNPELISRTHFARCLVERGVCRDNREVFTRFLVEGKPGYVPHPVGAARAGGALDRRCRRRSGDRAPRPATGSPETNCGCSPPSSATSVERRWRWSRAITARRRRSASPNSRSSSASARRAAADFHGPGESHAELGRVGLLPYRLTPVWERLL